jgi:hypothetical protein
VLEILVWRECAVGKNWVGVWFRQSECPAHA